MTFKLNEPLHNSRFLLILTACLLAFSGTSINSTFADTKEKPAADNSKINQKDRAGQEPTAGQQSSDKKDIEITRKVRQELVNDKNLSTYAHNVKIITENGKVILKGPVRSAEEKAAVEQKAQTVAGAKNVQDQLEVVQD